MMKIFLIGYKGHNLGDDLFFLHIIKTFPHCKFFFEESVSNYYQQLFQSYHNVEVLHPSQPTLFKKCIRKIKKLINIEEQEDLFTLYSYKTKINVDVVVYIGGSIFMEPTKDILLPERRNKAILNYFQGVPIVYVGSNFGPYTTSKYMDSVRRRIVLSADVCFRDKYSYDIFKDISSVRYAPDVLFDYKIVPSNTIIKNSIGISLIDLSSRKKLREYETAYLHSIASFLKNEKFEKIIFFDFCNREGDINAINKVFTMLPEYLRKKVEIIRYNGNPDYFLSFFSQVETVVATRFHAMILSLTLRKRTIPIIYSKKMLNVINDMVTPIDYVSLQSINSSSIENILLKYRNPDIEDLIIESKKQFDYLANYTTGSL